MAFRFAIFLLVFLSAPLFSSHISSFAQESVLSVYLTPTPVQYTLPYPGILPDHPLYFLKQWRDNVLLFFTRNPVKKAQLYLLLGNKKLVMFQQLFEKQNLNLSLTILEEGERNLLTSSSMVADLKRIKSLPNGLDEEHILSAKKHEEIITTAIQLSNDTDIQSRLTIILRLTHQANQQLSSSQ